MTRTHTADTGRVSRPRATWPERAIVLGGIAGAALCTPTALAFGLDMEIAGAVWLAAIVWTVPSSLALAIRRGLRDGDWTAFRRHTLSDGRDERMDWASRTGRYAYLRVAEEHRRLMLGT